MAVKAEVLQEKGINCSTEGGLNCSSRGPGWMLGITKEGVESLMLQIYKKFRQMSLGFRHS